MKASLVSKKYIFIIVVCFVVLLILPHFINYHISVDGGYTEWSEWGPCSATCGVSAVKGKWRSCTNPSPKGSGASCTKIGPDVLLTECPPLVNCPQHGKWSEWTTWGACEPFCKDGKRKRIKTCTNPAPKDGGRPCVFEKEDKVNGDMTEIREELSCDNLYPCPINGGVSVWEAWGVCSKTCGEGHKERKRACNNPEPRYKGKGCTDHLHEAEMCKLKDCPTPKTSTTQQKSTKVTK